VLQALDLLVAGGLASRTTLMFTPMCFNVTELPAIVVIAAERGIGTVYISLLEDRGRAHDQISSLAPPKVDIPRLVFSAPVSPGAVSGGSDAMPPI
jgi:hypothetical protein